LRIALAQLDSRDDRAANLARISEQAKSAADRGADLLMLPEACAYRGVFKPELAEDASGPTLQTIGAAAARYRIALLAGGVWLRSADPLRPYNAAVFIDENGAMLGAYRKVHLFRVDLDAVREDEAAYTTPGDELVTVTWQSIVFGLSICYDLRFPELYRALAAAGAEVLCVPSNFSAYTGRAHWTLLLRARAVENGCYVLAPAQTGVAPGGFASYGHSLVVDPWGEIEGDAGREPGLIASDISAARLAECRAALNPLPQVRPQVYARVSLLPEGHAREPGRADGAGRRD
jgi:deaminated glutathione amidase